MNSVNPIDANAMWERMERNTRLRAEAMPTSEDAIKAMQQAYIRLTELGWRGAMSAPKDGTTFEAVEAGCGTAGDCLRWENGHFWMQSHGDLWPSNPILWRPKQEDDYGES